MDRLPSWAFLLGLALYAGLLATLTILFPGGFVDRYIWQPLSQTGNYNTANTIISLMIVLGLVLGWVYRLMAELGERVDLELTVAVVPYLVWGSVFHVLEDSDLFAPFSERILATGGSYMQADASCWPAAGGGFLHSCLGVFFQTPVIYVAVTIVAVFVFWLGHLAKRVSTRAGAAAGLRFAGLTYVGAFALYLALWSADPTFIRWVANPLVAFAALAIAFWIVWRDTRARGFVNPRWFLFSYGIAFLTVGSYYVFVWMTGGVPGWRPDAKVSWWVLAALIIAPLLVVVSTRLKGRRLSGGFPDLAPGAKVVDRPGRHVALLVALVILDGLAIFVSVLAVHHIEQRLQANQLFASGGALLAIVAMLAVGPAVLVATTWFAARLARGGLGIHPALVFFVNPVNLIMVFGQSADALMTSLGIDVFHYTEKHVLPGRLIGLLENAHLPAPWGDYSATLVMIPLKILIVLLVVWLIDASAGEDTVGRRNLVGLVKLAIIMVGLSPGVRDAVRLAMAT